MTVDNLKTLNIYNSQKLAGAMKYEFNWRDYVTFLLKITRKEISYSISIINCANSHTLVWIILIIQIEMKKHNKIRLIAFFRGCLRLTRLLIAQLY